MIKKTTKKITLILLLCIFCFHSWNNTATVATQYNELPSSIETLAPIESSSPTCNSGDNDKDHTTY